MLMIILSDNSFASHSFNYDSLCKGITNSFAHLFYDIVTVVNLKNGKIEYLNASNQDIQINNLKEMSLSCLIKTLSGNKDTEYFFRS